MADEVQTITVEILKQIRDETRLTREELGKRIDAVGARLDVTHVRMEAMARENAARFEAIETALRDVAEQLVMLARGVKAAIERRERTDDRLDEIERRLGELEKRTSS